MESKKVTVEEINDLISNLVDLRAKKKSFEDQASAIESDIRHIQGKILDTLKHANLKTFKGTVGLVTAQDRTSYKLPDNESDLAALQTWYESKGLRHMLKPNSISHNSIMAREYEAAKEAGDPFFVVPGAGQPIVTTILSMRETK